MTEARRQTITAYVLAIITFAASEPCLAQVYYRTVPSYRIVPANPYPSNGAIIGSGMAQAYDNYQASNSIRQWQSDTRTQWQMDQIRRDQYLQRQDQLRALQQQQQRSMVQPYPQSTPMYVQPIPQQRQQQLTQQTQQLYTSRNQTLQQWNMPPIRRR